MPSDDALVQDLAARLDVPPRARLDVLSEVREDIEAMVDFLVAQGVNRPAAEQRAIALLHPGDEAVAALTAVHMSPYRQLGARVGHGMVRTIERTTVVTMACLAAAAPLPALILGEPQPVWATIPLLALAGVMVALLTRETLRWWGRSERSVRALAHAAGIQAGMVGLTLAWGALAAAVQGSMATATWQALPPSSQTLAAWVAQVTTLLALALGVAMLGIFGSLALMQALWQARNLEGALTELLHSSDLNR